MNQTIQTITNHRSIRKYLDKDLEAGQLDNILAAAHAMPTSIHGQQVSVIVVRDAERRRQISGLAGNQTWIAAAPVFLVFVMDLHKTAKAGEKHNQAQVIQESAEGVVMATFDAGLAMGAAIVAAESLGLGIVPIGGIRRNPQAIIDLLELPAYTYPVAGLVVGLPADPSARKPRLPLESFVHEERYNEAAVDRSIEAFDLTMAEYYRKRGDKSTDWSSQVSDTYKQVYYPLVYPTLKAQGFRLDK